MPKRKRNLNNIYISERLRDCLSLISSCPLTTVIAPMGYGKTTAVNWYLEECEKNEEIFVVRISVYSDNLMIFWKSVQDAFAYSGFDFLKEYPCPSDMAGSGMLTDDLCHELAGDKPCYIFIDDFHLLKNESVSVFLCNFANRIPTNVHLIVVGRDRCLPNAQIVRLGAKVYQINVEHLRLNHFELTTYTRRCGTELSDEEINSLLYSSEGWFSAIYLNLRTFAEQGTLPDSNSDIYTMFTAEMIDPLSQKQKEFLAVMGLADEFSIQMAQFVTEISDTEKVLFALTEHNAFVKRLADNVTFRFHHMMKECAERTFLQFPVEKQGYYHNRFGMWYEDNGQYLYAMKSYGISGNFDALLDVILKDAGILLSHLNPEDVIRMMDKCPERVLKRHPLAILVLMRSMFNWRLIPKMMEMKELLLTSIKEQPGISEEERSNLLGECDLITSFLMFNDISAMSRLHRSASEQMSRIAVTIQKSGGWTFGSPSILMQYYREPGALKSELREMYECMPHYYKITDGHGQGAEKIMHAEAEFQQGNFNDAQIELERAYAKINENWQENMAICCDFLWMRLSLCVDIKERYTFEERYKGLLSHHNSSWINLFNSCCAYYFALRREEDKIPEIFRGHKLSEINLLAPGKPVIDMIENQVYLMQGAYAKVIGRSEGLLAVCGNMHYKLVDIHINIQTAAAYKMLGKNDEAKRLLLKIIDDAACDGFVMPFVENYYYISELLDEYADYNKRFTTRIMELGSKYEERLGGLYNQHLRLEIFNELTEREYEIVGMMAQRLSNREIAERIFLSEGSVKQYINQIYSKLHIGGDTRTKRRQLLAMINDNI